MTKRPLKSQLSGDQRQNSVRVLRQPSSTYAAGCTSSSPSGGLLCLPVRSPRVMQSKPRMAKNWTARPGARPGPVIQQLEEVHRSTEREAPSSLAELARRLSFRAFANPVCLPRHPVNRPRWELEVLSAGLRLPLFDALARSPELPRLSGGVQRRFPHEAG